METIKLNVSAIEKQHSYQINIGISLFGKIREFISTNFSKHRLVIITDENVNKFHGLQLKKHLVDFTPIYFQFEPGERSKSRRQKELIEDFLLENHCNRDTLIIAFGGGVVGDMAGYVASTFNRGIPFIQIPTTILSMVDSSVGGKTGINTKHGKNLIGSFWPPKAVFCDLEVLETLPDVEFLNGMVEVIKAALIMDIELVQYLENNNKDIIKRKTVSLQHVIKESLKIKKMVVENDPFESGKRQILNFGHTIGHALEILSDFKIKHGFAVGLGMIVESWLAKLDKSLSLIELKRIVSLLELYKLPVRIDKKYRTNDILKIIKMDKKSKNQVPRFVLLKGIGEVKSQENTFSFSFSEKFIEQAVKESR